MRHSAPPSDPMAEIEARQDELLRRLDELNSQVEQVLAEFTPHVNTATAATND